MSADDLLHAAQKHSQAALYPKVVTLELLFALKGVGNRAFFRWPKRDYLPLFPRLSHRTRLFRLFNTHLVWIERFLAEPTLLRVIDTYGIDRSHPLTRCTGSRFWSGNYRPPVRRSYHVVASAQGLKGEDHCTSAKHDPHYEQHSTCFPFERAVGIGY